eukprot:Selendium_serpulae@DN2833_c0_g1_i5.p1
MNSKPLLLFQGPGFESSTQLASVKNLFIDMFSGNLINSVDLKEVDHAIVFTALDPTTYSAAGERQVIRFAHYFVELAPSELGPSFDLTLDRSRVPDLDAWKESMKAPSEDKKKPKKNISTNVLGETRGRIHLGQQNFTDLHTPHHHGEGGKQGTKRRKVA